MKVKNINMEKSITEFYKKLAVILEVEEIKPENLLSDFEAWDSLSILSVIVMADSDYGLTIYARDIKELKTVEDLFLFIKEKKDENK